jgi:hypothetical protein
VIRRTLEAAVVALAALAWFLAFRDYGFQLEDEGTLLFHLDRASRGMLPYTDFHTGYTPGFFAAGSRLLLAVDYRVDGMRTGMAFLNAFSVAALYAAARTVLPAAFALVPAFLWLVLMPVFPGGFASFNVPYPAWPAAASWMLLALALLAWLRRPRAAWLVAAGVAAALAFAVKPNAGAFAMAGAIWGIAPFLDAGRPVDRFLAVAAVAAMAFGAWTAFGWAIGGTDVVLFLLPALAMALVAARGAGCLARSDAPRPLPALVALSLGFTLPTLLWLVPTLARLGLDGFARDVLLLGSGAAELYHTNHPAPEFFALVLAVGVVGFVAVSLFIRKREVPFVALLAAATLPLAVVAWRLATVSMAIEGLRQALLAQLENAAMLLVPLAHVGGAVLLWRAVRAGETGEDSRPSQADNRERGLLLLAALGAAMYLQVWPRVDYTHFVWASPLSLVLAFGLALRLGRCWRGVRLPGGAGADRLVAASMVIGVLALGFARMSLIVPPLVAALGNEPAIVTPRLMVAVEPEASDDLSGLGMTLAWLAARAQPGEDVLAFPAMSGALFALGLRNPLPHDYWYPGRPDRSDEARMVATLEASPPRYAITPNRRWVFFQNSPWYFARARSFARERYRLAARFGRFDVLARRDLPEEPVVRWQPTGPLEDAIEPRLLPRQQAAERWLAGLTPEAARDAKLPQDRGAARLLLRAIRDTADIKAASWLVEAWEGPDPVLRREALHAMRLVAETFDAALYGWAGDFQPGDAAPWVEHLGPWAEAVQADAEAEVLVWFADTIRFALGVGNAPVRPAEYRLLVPDEV